MSASQLSDPSLATGAVVTPSPETVKLIALDGVRGLAILMVMVLHAVQGNTDSSAGLRLGRKLLSCGRFGVDLFFVLSGFLITGILIDTYGDSHYIQRFFARRALRILPLYYGVLLVLLALTPIVHFAWHGMAPWLLLYLQNFRPQVLNDLSLIPGGVGLYHLWSLAIEEQFYLVWPFVILMLKGKRERVLQAAVVGTVAVLCLRLVLIHGGVSYEFIHTSSLTRADSLLIGGVLAVLYRDAKLWPQVLRVSPFIFVSFTVCFFAVMLTTDFGSGASMMWNEGWQYTMLAVGFAGLLAWSLKPKTFVQRAFSHAWLRWLGKYSYGLYLLHVPIITLMNVPLRVWLRPYVHSSALAALLAALITLALSVVLAWVSFQAFEKHFLKLKKRFAYTRIQPARVAPG